jgi:hypothetical protein
MLDYSIILNGVYLFSIFKKDKKDADTLDVSINENHSFTSEITSTVLQDNSIVSDHVVLRPHEIIVSGMVSDTPIEYGNISNLSRSKEFYSKLKELRAGKEVVKLVTSLDVFDSMYLYSIDIPRDKNKSKALFVDLKFKYIQKVEINSKSIKSKDIKTKHQNQTSIKQNKGTVQAKEVPAVQKEALISKSWAYRIFK